MKSVVVIVGLLACCAAVPAMAADADVESWHAALDAARWTGPLLASTAETLPQGHFYTEPYLFDTISSGQHNAGSSGFYQYGLFDNYTVGVQPSFSLGTRMFNRDVALGDFKLLSQLRVSHFTAEHRVPSIALVMNLIVPTGKDDDLKPREEGHGRGTFAPEIGVNLQQYLRLKNGRLVRVRLNVLKNFPLKARIAGRSVYQTSTGFTGHAKPGSKTTLVAALEYSVTRAWVLAFDVERDEWGKSRVVGGYPDGRDVNVTSRGSWSLGFAPAVEYNWSDRGGAILGLWIVPRGHNSSSSITPAIAVQRFW